MKLQVEKCTQCGAALEAGAQRCWLCLADENTVGTESPFATGYTPQPPIWAGKAGMGATFRLDTLMLAITLIAVCLGLLRLSPGLGVLLVILVTPAFVRAAVAVRRQRASGLALDTPGKVLAFLASLGIVTASAVASGAAFYATCWAGFLGGAAISQAAGAQQYDPLGYGLLTGVIMGGLGGLAVLVVMIRWLWPVRQTAKTPQHSPDVSKR